jgi:hypothetical protein
MNAKEEILKMLKEQLEQKEAQMPYKTGKVELFKNLIAATESAIFDLPSDEEMVKECMKFTDIAKDKTTALSYTIGFGDAVNFIHNYKKSEL